MKTLRATAALAALALAVVPVLLPVGWAPLLACLPAALLAAFAALGPDSF